MPPRSPRNANVNPKPAPPGGPPISRLRPPEAEASGVYLAGVVPEVANVTPEDVDAALASPATTLELVDAGDPSVANLAKLPEAPGPDSKPRDWGNYVRTILTSREADIAKLMPEGGVRRLIASATKAIIDNPDLLGCCPISIIGAVMDAARLGLDCSGVNAQGYLIPRWNDKRGRTEATFQVGYKGVLSLFYGSGYVVRVDPQCVFKGDRFAVELGTAPVITHVPDLNGDRHDNAIEYVYAVAELRDAEFPVSQVMTRAQVEKVRAKSKQPNGFAWMGWYDAMALKTVVMRLRRAVPSTPKLSLAGHLEALSSEEDGETPTNTTTPGASFSARLKAAQDAKGTE